MDKIGQDLEKVKKILWSVKNSLDIESIQAKLINFQNQVETDVNHYIAQLSESLTSLQTDVENEVTSQINSFVEFKENANTEINTNINEMNNNLNSFKQNVQNDLQTDFNVLSTSVDENFLTLQSQVNASVSEQNQEINKFKEDVSAQLEAFASAGTNGAMTDGSNIIVNKWIEKLLTGQVDYGEKIIAKSLAANGYIKYASGLIIQWGNDYENVDKTDYQTASVNFPTAFSASNSYAVAIAPRRSSAINYRDTVFAIKSLTTSGFGYMWYGQSYANDKWQLQWVAIGY
ncbi:MAG: hypothetical protein E7379_04590 [Clostridiales bacterium]|nr:hypothetical protein [Clostridiales bacterium]